MCNLPDLNGSQRETCCIKLNFVSHLSTCCIPHYRHNFLGTVLKDSLLLHGNSVFLVERKCLMQAFASKLIAAF